MPLHQIDAREITMTETTTDTTIDNANEDGAGQLGDAGKRALDRMKQERNEARTALKAFQDLGLPADQISGIIKQHSEHDQQAALNKARLEGAQEAREGFEKQIRTMAAREAAARKGFHDPAAAVLYLGDALNEIPVTDSGVDTEKLEEQLNSVVEKHSYLVQQKQDGESFSTLGLGAQGDTAALNGDGIENSLKKALGIR